MKTAIVTGANSGIGKVTATALAREGYNIGIVCRNEAKARAAHQEIVQATGNQNVEIFLADLGDIAQINRVATAIQQRYSQIDVLVNNAGFIAKGYREITRDGLERTFAVNHIGYFLLTNLLKAQLLAAPAARIVSVSSEAHRFTTADMQNLQLAQGYNALKAYALSKLCNVLFTRELARRLQGTPAVANCLHPGGVGTGFAGDSTWLYQTIMYWLKPLLLTPEQGAETSIYLALDAAAAALNGEYLERKRVRRPSTDALNADKAAQLWQISAEICSLADTF